MNAKKILLLGKNGMAGQTIYKYVKKQSYDIVGLDSYDFNVLFNDLNEVVDLNEYYVVINCIGLLNHETDVKKLILVNSLFPQELEELSDYYDFKLIHISTDCYLDNTPYGHSKWLGELKDSLTLRTSIIGHDNYKKGTGLLNWFLDQKGIVRGYKNHIWYGITTLELAKVMEKSIEMDLKGIIEVTNGEPISKYALLKLIKDEYKLDTKLEGIYLDQYVIKELNKDIDFDIPFYDDMIHEMRLFNEED